MELAHQLFVVMGLRSAGRLAGLLGRTREAGDWAEAAVDLRKAMLKDERFSLIEAGVFIKRRGLDGAVQREVRPDTRASLPPETPLFGPGRHLLDPGHLGGAPDRLGIRRSGRAAGDEDPGLDGEALEPALEGRRIRPLQRDLGTRFARTMAFRLPLRRPGRARGGRSAGGAPRPRWLGRVPGSRAGSWFEFYGPRPVPPYPQVGIIPWTWAELVFLFVHHMLGVRPGDGWLGLHPPRLLPGWRATCRSGAAGWLCPPGPPRRGARLHCGGGAYHRSGSLGRDPLIGPREKAPMPARRIHLVCNAHLDPVWLWEWEEGAGETLSTFRPAADFCEEFDGFVFNHNEAAALPLGRGVRAGPLPPDPQARPREAVAHHGRLVRPARLQHARGESFVRQILLGRRYFAEKFGVEPRDGRQPRSLRPHARPRPDPGQERIPPYLFCRPAQPSARCPRRFRLGRLRRLEGPGQPASAHYCSVGGQARARLEKWLAANPDGDLVIHLWGIGNHGGGPSRKDLADLEALAKERPDLELVHSTPDAYFGSSRGGGGPAAPREGPQSLGRRLLHLDVPGQAGHRRLENEPLRPRRWSRRPGSRASCRIPARAVEAVMRDLAFVEFHDILPGSPSGRRGGRLDVGHGLEIAVAAQGPGLFRAGRRRAQGRGGRDPRSSSTIPTRSRGPGARRMRIRALGAELRSARAPKITARGKALPSQTEKEESNLSLEWRKRVVFEADLAPGRLQDWFSGRLPPKKPEARRRRRPATSS